MSVSTDALLDCSLLQFTKRESRINEESRFDNTVFCLGNQGQFSAKELSWLLIKRQISRKASFLENASLRTELPFPDLPVTALGNNKAVYAQRAFYLEVSLVTLRLLACSLGDSANRRAII